MPGSATIRSDSPPHHYEDTVADSLANAEQAPEVVVTPARMVKGWVFLLVLLTAGFVLAGWGVVRGWSAYWTRSYRVQCQAMKSQADWRSLRQVAERWVAWDPQSHLGWWFAAEAAQNLSDFPAMARYLGQVPTSDPNYLLSLVEKANLEWTALNHPLEAVRTSEQILKIDPEIVEVHSRLVSFYAMNLQRVPMLKAIHRAMENNSQTREMYTYYVMADLLSYTNGSQMNSRWLASSPDEHRFKIGLGVHTAMNLAMNVDAARTEDSVRLDQEANRQLDFFLEKAPGDSVLLTYMMHRAYQAGDVQLVSQLLQKVSGDSIDDHMVWVYRAWYHTTMGELDDSEKAIQEAIRLHPASPLAHHEYANLLRKRGQLDLVEREQNLAAIGRELRTRLLRSPNANTIEADILLDIARYLRACGDQRGFDSLEIRLREFGYSSLEASPQP